jgi:hypothetical protein
MVALLAGVASFLITLIIFIMCLPRGGKTHRFVGTEWEPYVGVAFCSGFALSFTLLLSGAIELWG